MTQLLINTVVGAAGGWLGNMLKKNGLGMIGNLVAGGAGGNALGFLMPMIMGGGAAAANADAGIGGMIGPIVTALLGGGAGSLIGGLIKKA